MAAPHQKYGRVQGSWPNVADSGSADSSGWKHYTDIWVPGRQWRGRAALNDKSGSRWKLWKSRKFPHSRTLGFQVQPQIRSWVCARGDGRVQWPWCHLKSMKSEAGEKTPFVIWTLPHQANKPWATAGTGWPVRTFLLPKIPSYILQRWTRFLVCSSQQSQQATSRGDLVPTLQAFRTQTGGYWYEIWYVIILTHQ